VAVLLADVQAIDRVRERDIVKYMHEQPWAQVATDLVAMRAQGRDIDAGEVLATIDQAARARLAARLLEDATFADPTARQKVFDDCIERVAAPTEAERMKRMLAELRRFEELGDEDGAAELLARWNAGRRSDSNVARPIDKKSGSTVDRESDEGQ